MKISNPVAGAKFGRLTVLELVREPGKAHLRFRCKCDCGAECCPGKYALIKGITKSCGCLRRELNLTNGIKHGRSRTPEHNAWINMHQRCKNIRHQNYYRYGARGISVCERWGKFESFLADMGPRPAGTSIDRIDNNGNYEPGNCRWASIKQQSRNKRSNVFYEFNGQKRCLIDWIEWLGLPEKAVRQRIEKGIPFEQAIQRPFKNELRFPCP